MKKNILCAVALCVATLASASQNHNGYQGTTSIGSIWTKKYTLSKAGETISTASSESYFTTTDSYSEGSVFSIFDRKNNYAYLFALKSRFPNSMGRQAAIVDDALLVTAESGSNGLWIDSIHKMPASKKIKFNKEGTIYSLHAMPNKTDALSFVHNGCVVMNIETEQVECSFNINDKATIQHSIPTKDGNGIWYRATAYSTESHMSKIGFYDIRSGKAQLLAIELPPFYGRISANPSNTRCAFAHSGQLLIYDVVANKKDVTILPSTEGHVEEAFFANDDTVVYNVTRSKLQDAENTLHTLTLSASPIIKRASSTVPNASYFRYHDHTQLLITVKTFSGIDTIYDFSNKQ